MHFKIQIQLWHVILFPRKVAFFFGLPVGTAFVFLIYFLTIKGTYERNANGTA